jgi:hypothetical protein
VEHLILRARLYVCRHYLLGVYGFVTGFVLHCVDEKSMIFKRMSLMTLFKCDT